LGWKFELQWCQFTTLPKFGGSSIPGVNGNRTIRGTTESDLEAGNFRKGSESLVSDMEMKNISRSSSEDHIIDSGKNTPLKINVTTAYALKDEEEGDTSSTARADKERAEESAAADESKNSFRSESALRMERWGSTTQITVGERRESAGATRMLGMGPWT
jgi:hypothetical protein